MYLMKSSRVGVISVLKMKQEEKNKARALNSSLLPAWFWEQVWWGKSLDTRCPNCITLGEKTFFLFQMQLRLMPQSPTHPLPPAHTHTLPPTKSPVLPFLLRQYGCSAHHLGKPCRGRKKLAGGVKAPWTSKKLWSSFIFRKGYFSEHLFSKNIFYFWISN